MLKDVIEFVKSRAGIPDRATALREINFAWREIWVIDDIPGSLEEVTVSPSDRTLVRCTLPYFVYRPKGVKGNYNKERYALNTPRKLYQYNEYVQSPFSFRELGSSPLSESITNATTLKLEISEPETEVLVVTLIGPTDNAVEDREQITFMPGETRHTSTKRFSDLSNLSKDIITKSNVKVLTQTNTQIAIIPNSAYESRNVIIQITDKCSLCSQCACFDVLYKKHPPILLYDEQYIPNGYDEALAAKTLEWIMLPKEDKPSMLFAEKSRELMVVNNEDTSQGQERRLDMGTNQFTSNYHGYL